MLSYQEREAIEKKLREAVKNPLYKGGIKAMKCNVERVIDNLIDYGTDVEELEDIVQYVACEFAFKVKSYDYQNKTFVYGRVLALISGYNDAIEFSFTLGNRNHNFPIEWNEEENYFCIGDYNFLQEQE